MCVNTGADGVRRAEPCECQHERRVAERLKRASIPEEYGKCSFDTFDLKVEHADGKRSLFRASGLARTYVSNYSSPNDGVGLLFTGTVGTGKTHLATSVLRQLIIDRGVRGVFCDYRELLKKITNSFNPQVKTTEFEVLKPIFDAEVLLLDELGAARSTDWVFDTVEHILNTRYSSKRVTLITTNYPNLPETLSLLRHSSSRDTSDAGTAAQEAMRDETLGDRIGARMWSRLQQMCIPIKMEGLDYRLNVKKARMP